MRVHAQWIMGVLLGCMYIEFNEGRGNRGDCGGDVRGKKSDTHYNGSRHI